ncbi:hypothetical protein [Methylobacterium tarhaniae]|uniref:hypothetical protein n=1 Tax=Methylobacterium tarhaniae TaxID=1187852 RepID=UPI003CFF3CDB
MHEESGPMGDMGFLKAIFDSLAGFPVLQAAVGALILLGGLKLMLKADKIKDGAVAPAPAPIPDAPQMHLQGNIAYLDLQREKRDLQREMRDHLGRIAECVRIMREESRRQTEILESIEREQDIQGRTRQRHHDD